jgi:hypothetical protein
MHIDQTNARLKKFHTRFLSEGFVGGPTVSIADFSVCALLHCTKAGPFFDALIPEIKDYYERFCEAVPAFVKVCDGTRNGVNFGIDEFMEARRAKYDDCKPGYLNNQ